MNNFYEELSKCKDSEPIALMRTHCAFAECYVLQSRTIPTINDLFDKKYLDLTYPELLKVCNDVPVELSLQGVKLKQWRETQ